MKKIINNDNLSNKETIKDDNAKEFIREINKKNEYNITEVIVKMIEVSKDLVVYVDKSGDFFPSDELYCKVRIGGNVKEALKDAIAYLHLKENAGKNLVFKFNDIEIRFGREDKYSDILKLLQAAKEFSGSLEDIKKGKGTTI